MSVYDSIYSLILGWVKNETFEILALTASSLTLSAQDKMKTKLTNFLFVVLEKILKGTSFIWV